MAIESVANEAGPRAFSGNDSSAYLAQAMAVAELVQAARAYQTCSDLIRLDRESVQAAHRLWCVLIRFADPRETRTDRH
jgi:hypothetical protein